MGEQGADAGVTSGVGTIVEIEGSEEKTEVVRVQGMGVDHLQCTQRVRSQERVGV